MFEIIVQARLFEDFQQTEAGSLAVFSCVLHHPLFLFLLLTTCIFHVDKKSRLHDSIASIFHWRNWMFLHYTYRYDIYIYIYMYFFFSSCFHAPNHTNWSYIEIGSLLKPVPKKYSNFWTNNNNNRPNNNNKYYYYYYYYYGYYIFIYLFCIFGKVFNSKFLTRSF